MVFSASTGNPATLRQWLLRSLSWTALCVGLVVGAWYCFPPFVVDTTPADGLRMLGVLLTHLGTTVLLGRQVRASGALYDTRAQASPWLLRLAAQFWAVVLLLLTWLWVLTDFALLLLGLLAMASRDATPHQPWF